MQNEWQARALAAIERVDAELAAAGVPISHRFFAAVSRVEEELSTRDGSSLLDFVNTRAWPCQYRAWLRRFRSRARGWALRGPLPLGAHH
jgi:hypothetical protein